MIQYMPFSYVKDSQLRCLSNLVGSFTVCQAAETLVPATLQAWADKGLLTFTFPRGVDEVQLQLALAEHRQWAGLHAGHMLDRVGGVLAVDGRPPLVSDDDVSQILTRLRPPKDPAASEGAANLLRAALLLAIWLEYDQQQEAVAQSLTSAQDLEQAMFAELRGETGGMDDTAPRAASMDAALPAELTGRILWAWAMVARCADNAPKAFITCTGQVVAEIQERVSTAVQLGSWPFETGSTAGGWPMIVQGVAAAADPLLAAQQLLPRALQPAREPCLTMVVLPDCPPSEFLRRLSAGVTALPHAPVWEEPPHTVLALVSEPTGRSGQV